MKESILEKLADIIGTELVNEAFDVKKIINDLMKTDFKGSNEEQMKGLQLLKGLATNDSKEANDFMSKLSDAYTKIGKEVLGSVDEGDDNDSDNDDKKDDKKKKKNPFIDKKKEKDGDDDEEGEETDESMALRMQTQKRLKKKK